MQVRVQSEPFAFGAEAEAFARRQSQSGAVVTFSGIVRDTEAGLVSMEIEGVWRTASAMHALAFGAMSIRRRILFHRAGVARLFQWWIFVTVWSVVTLQIVNAAFLDQTWPYLVAIYVQLCTAFNAFYNLLSSISGRVRLAASDEE